MIGEHHTFRGMQEVLTDVTRSGSSLLVALIIRAVARLATDTETTLPLCCLRLLRSYTHNGNPMPKEVVSSIVADLAGLISDKKGFLRSDLETLHRQLDIECARRTKSVRVDEVKTGALISQAVKRGIAEFTQRPQRSLAAAAIPFNPESRFSRTIDSVVRTEEFAAKYLERMEKAVTGDVGPLLRLVEIFSRKIASPDCALTEVSGSLLHYARTAHGIPEDDVVWRKIFIEVQSKMIGRG